MPSSPSVVRSSPVTVRVTTPKESFPEYRAQIVDDLSLPDGTVVGSNHRVTKMWRMKNSGSVAWPVPFMLTHVSGDFLGIGTLLFQEVVEPGATFDIFAEFVVPSNPGRHISYYRLCSADGQEFGNRLWIDIIVETPKATPKVTFDPYCTIIPQSIPSVYTNPSVAKIDLATSCIEVKPPVETQSCEKHSSIPEKPLPETEPHQEFTFAKELAQFRDMGFKNDLLLAQLLEKHRGDFNETLEELLM